MSIHTTGGELADLFERLTPYLDWPIDATDDDLRQRLISVTRVLNDFGAEVRARKD